MRQELKYNFCGGLTGVLYRPSGLWVQWAIKPTKGCLLLKDGHP